MIVNHTEENSEEEDEESDDEWRKTLHEKELWMSWLFLFLFNTLVSILTPMNPKISELPGPGLPNLWKPWQATTAKKLDCYMLVANSQERSEAGRE